MSGARLTKEGPSDYLSQELDYLSIMGPPCNEPSEPEESN